MSETQPRAHASRGRSSARGGRGGPRNGGRGGKHINGDHKSAAPDTTADQGELGELKRQYPTELGVLKEVFGKEWSEDELLLALQESNYDLNTTMERISEGNVSKFAEVSKSKDRARSKAKDAVSTTPEATQSIGRQARGRGGPDGGRGSRGGRPDRGRGGFRGGSRGAAQSVATDARVAETTASVPTNESSAWDTIATNKDSDAVKTVAAEKSDWASAVADETTATSASNESAGKPKTWASMFAPKPKAAAQPPRVRTQQVPELQESLPPPVSSVDIVAAGTPNELPPNIPSEDESIKLAPSKDALTEDNVEHLPDDSISKPMTETAASQVGSTRDIGSGTPSLAAQAPIGRPGLGGYATTALKATTGAGRSASFQRKILEQREAVVMPSNDAVHRSAVQFGMMDLNGNALDVDEDREEAETRPQAPPQSPPSQPRASLPPSLRQTQPDAISDALPQARQGSGLPPASAQQQSSPSNALGGLPQPTSQSSQAYNQFGRLGNQSGQSDAVTSQQKSYDSYGQQAGSLDEYASQAQSHLGHQQGGNHSAASNEYASYYSGDQRNAYQNYYNNPYGQHNPTAQQDAGSAQSKAGTGFGQPSGESGYGSQSQQAASRFTDAQGSGQNTPAPGLGANSQPQAQHLQQQQALGQNQYQNYNHHPYYQSPYYQSYLNSQQSYYGNYGAPYGGGGKGGGMFGQNYGMNPQQSSYEHSSSPANAGGAYQAGLNRDSGLGGSGSQVGDFNRSGSAQPGQGSQQGASSSYGAMAESYGRGQGGYGTGTSSQYGSQQQGAQGNGDENLKAYGEGKPAGSGATAIGQPGRPGSATNASGNQAQSSHQAHQQGYGGYPNSYGQGSQYGGLGGLGNQGGAQNQGGFGAYGGYGNQYGSSYGRGGGWGNNFQSH